MRMAMTIPHDSISSDNLTHQPRNLPKISNNLTTPHKNLTPNQQRRSTYVYNYDQTQKLLHKLQNRHIEHYKSYMDKKKIFINHKINIPHNYLTKNKKSIQLSKIKKIFVPSLIQFTDLQCNEEPQRNFDNDQGQVQQLGQQQQNIKVIVERQNQINHKDNNNNKNERHHHRYTNRQVLQQRVHTDKDILQSGIDHLKIKNKQYKQPYYKYIQNNRLYKKLTTKQRKIFTQQDEKVQDSYSLKNSKSLKQKRTIFHQCKLQLITKSKFHHNKTQNDLSINSEVKHNNQQQLPLTQVQQEQFLKKYVPMDSKFHIKELFTQENFQIITQANYVYFGGCNNKGKHGWGILVTKRYIFEGKFKNNQKYKGFQKNNVGVYEGQFKNNTRNGHGIFVWNNGQRYQGQWIDGAKNGYGVWKSLNGNYYQGQWKQNKQNGKGFYNYFGKSKYNGYFKDFLKHGRGQQEFSNGDKFIGTYQNGKPHGYGKYIFSKGTVYQGEFVQGSRQGQGTLIYSQGGSYEGQFMDDMKHGRGIQKNKQGDYFEGQFRQDQKYSGQFYSKNKQIIKTL